MSRWWIQSYFPDSKCLGKLNPFQNCLNRRSSVAKSLSFKISSFDFDFKAFKTKIYKKAKQIIRHESLKILQKRGNKNQYTFIEKSIECCLAIAWNYCLLYQYKQYVRIPRSFELAEILYLSLWHYLTLSEL